MFALPLKNEREKEKLMPGGLRILDVDMSSRSRVSGLEKWRGEETQVIGTTLRKSTRDNLAYGVARNEVRGAKKTRR